MALLDGIRVLESASVISGPFTAMILADLGADVIKVERPTGDQYRRWESDEEGLRPSFCSFNRGKRSIVIDLKNDRGRDVYRTLVDTADVVIENYRPGTMSSLGLGYDELRSSNPGLVYCHITGQGTVGPDKDQPTFDAVAQALSGLWSQFVDLRSPEPIGPTMADQLTAIYAALAVLAGLQGRSRSGQGLLLEVNMLAACLAFQGQAIAAHTYQGKTTHRLSRAHQSQAYAFVAADGKPFAVHLSTPQKFWFALCHVVGRADLASDPRYDTKPKRIDRYEELHETFRVLFSAQPREYWLKLLEEADVPAAPIYTVGEALANPQVQVSEIVEQSSKGPGLGGLVKSPIRVDGKHLAATLPAPKLAAQTEEILRELALTQTEIADLRNAGAVGI